VHVLRDDTAVRLWCSLVGVDDEAFRARAQRLRASRRRRGYARREALASVSKVVTSIPTSSATCWGCRRSIFHAQLGMTAIGLTACSGDSWRDTVENTPMLVCVHACGGTDGACQGAALGRTVK